MNELPYSKDLSISRSYEDVYKHILDVADKVENYTLVSESKTVNRVVIKDTGINIEINIYKASDDVTNLKILTHSDKGRYFQSEPTVMKMVSRFENALIASIDGKLDEYEPKPTGTDAEGCSSMVVLIVAIVLIIFGVIVFLSV